MKAKKRIYKNSHGKIRRGYNNFQINLKLKNYNHVKILVKYSSNRIGNSKKPCLESFLTNIIDDSFFNCLF